MLAADVPEVLNATLAQTPKPEVLSVETDVREHLHETYVPIQD